ADGVGDLLHDRVGYLLADRVRHALADAFLDVLGAGDVLRHAVLLPDLAAADLFGPVAAPALDGLPRLAAALAGARVLAAGPALLDAADLLAGHAVLFHHPLAALAGDR